MLFNSYAFILLFLPAVALGYFLILRYASPKMARSFLLASSLGFISFWNILFSVVLLSSVLCNYIFGSMLSAQTLNDGRGKKILFAAAISTNIGFLGFFKYSHFFIDTVNTLFAASMSRPDILLPIGISFYTFMQIAWLTDIYRHGGYRYGFLTYCLYVTFFPYVISGPIAYHHEVIPQFESPKTGGFCLSNFCSGLFIFSIGLVKKTILADTLAIIANGGFDAAGALTFTEAWLTSLSYTMQLYFDFSGYTDMAIGVALIFNIELPTNFNSPYKSLNIQEFWRRWHITLSRFLRDYIYIPLGGNRFGQWRTLANLMLTFLIGGLWHGAAWTFVFWGFLHGMALCVHRVWKQSGMRMNRVLAWIVTFNFLNIAWVFFRATSWDKAGSILKGMAGLNGILVSPNLADSVFWQKMTVLGVRFGEWRENLPGAETPVYFLCIFLIPFVFLLKNSSELLQNFRPGWKNALAVGLMMLAGLLLLNETQSFLYFNF